MSDFAMVATTAIFFLLAWLYLRAAARLLLRRKDLRTAMSCSPRALDRRRSTPRLAAAGPLPLELD